MIKIKLNHKSEYPGITLLNDSSSNDKEIKLFKEKIMPDMQKEINLAFQEYPRNSSELAASLRLTMTHNAVLEKSHYIFAYYEINEENLGIYWYDKNSNVISTPDVKE